ncbi:MAG: hypothetical protein JWR77_972 [Rhizorhabdus sp.]|nr:hypothetical protein [Rhizorhabdus sp.]
MASDTFNDTPIDLLEGEKTSPFDAAAKAFGSTTSGFKDQAGAKAREYAGLGKDKTVEALDNVATLVSDAAKAVDEKLGDQYGGYIRQAADAVTGFADTLRAKDADDLVNGARDAVRSSPAIAIAAAAAVGFLVARVVKSGFAEKAANDDTAAPPPTEAPDPARTA